MDVWGLSPKTPNDFKYYLIVGEFSRFSWLFSLIAKSQVFSTFVEFQNTIEKYLDVSIKSIQCD